MTYFGPEDDPYKKQKEEAEQILYDDFTDQTNPISYMASMVAPNEQQMTQLGKVATTAGANAVRGNYWTTAASIGGALINPYTGSLGLPILQTAGMLLDKRSTENKRQKAFEEMIAEEKKIAEEKAQGEKAKELTTQQMMEEMRRSQPMPNTSTLAMKYGQGKFGERGEHTFQPENVANMLPDAQEKRRLKGLSRAKRATDAQRYGRGPLSSRNDGNVQRGGTSGMSRIRMQRELVQ